MPSRVSSRIQCAALLVAAGLSLLGCDQPLPRANAPTSGEIRPWEGHAREVFDDAIDPAAVGLSLEGPSPRTDPFLRERAQTADVAARVRVRTVTVDTIGDQRTYHLNIEVIDPPLATPRVEERSFELLIRPTSAAFGIVKSFDARLRGMTFVGFVQRFVGTDGETELHWHLSADTPEVQKAVKEAVALKELSGS